MALESDIQTMLTSFATSIPPLMRLFTGLAYILGIFFVFKGLSKASIYGRSRAMSPTNAPLIVPITYIVVGMLLIATPTFFQVVTNTFFGMNSPLAYQSWFTQMVNLYGNSTYVVEMTIKLAGVIWFIRGCALIVQSSEPGSQHGMRGVVFLIAGIFAMNFQYTADFLSNTVESIVSGKIFLHPDEINNPNSASGS